MEQTIEATTETNQVTYAGFWYRFLAFWTDFLIVFVIGLTIQTALGNNPFSALIHAKDLAELQEMQGSTSSTISGIVGLLVGIAYYSIFYVNYDGATPGKRLMAIKVIKDDGTRITYLVAIIRYLASFLSGAILFIGYLFSIWDKRKQALHDKIAKTLVIRTDAKPKTWAGILVTLIALSLYIGYISFVAMLGAKLGMEQVESTKKDTTVTSIKSYKENMSPEAKVHYDRSMQLFSDMRAASDNLEEIKRLNDMNILELKAAIEIDPTNADIWYQLGNAYTWVSSTGTLEDGLAAFKKAEELDKNNVVYSNGVGDTLIRLGKYEEAVIQFQKSLRISDNSGFANLSIAIAYTKLGIKESAREHYQTAIDIFTKENKDGSYDKWLLEARKGLATVSN